jgi:hypothetical protein
LEDDEMDGAKKDERRSQREAYLRIRGRMKEVGGIIKESKLMEVNLCQERTTGDE